MPSFRAQMNNLSAHIYSDGREHGSDVATNTPILASAVPVIYYSIQSALDSAAPACTRLIFSNKYSYLGFSYASDVLWYTISF
jgi:hypothetical protein